MPVCLFQPEKTVVFKLVVHGVCAMPGRHSHLTEADALDGIATTTSARAVERRGRRIRIGHPLHADRLAAPVRRRYLPRSFLPRAPLAAPMPALRARWYRCARSFADKR